MTFALSNALAQQDIANANLDLKANIGLTIISAVVTSLTVTVISNAWCQENYYNIRIHNTCNELGPKIFPYTFFGVASLGTILSIFKRCT